MEVHSLTLTFPWCPEPPANIIGKYLSRLETADILLHHSLSWLPSPELPYISGLQFHSRVFQSPSLLH